jgi:MFS family permease
MTSPGRVEQSSTDDRASYGAVLRNTHFRSLWLAQCFSQVADTLVYFVLLVEVYRYTSSNAAVSTLVLAFMIPAVTIGPLAGVFVDRTDRRRVLWQTNASRAVLVLLFIWLGSHLLSILVVSLMISTVRQFFMPAEAATIPRLVSSKHLLPANSLFTLTHNASFILGMSTAGPLIKFGGPVTVYLVASAFFVIATILTLVLPPDPESRNRATLPDSLAARSRLVFVELAEGWNFLRHQGEMFRIMLQLAFAWSLAGVTAAIAPGYAATVLNLSEEDAFFLVAPAGFGVIVGSLLVGRFGWRVRRPILIAIGLISMGVAVILLATYRTLIQFALSHIPEQLAIGYHPGGLPGFLIVVMLLAGLFGISNASVVVPANTVMHEQTPPGFRGRVFAVLNSIGSLGSTAPVLVIGILADLLGVGQLMILIGLGIAIIGTISLRSAQKTRL